MKTRIILFVLLLCLAILGNVVQAEQANVPTMYIQLRVLENGAEISDPSQMPNWLSPFVFNVFTTLVSEGESPQLLNDDPQTLGDPLNTMAGTGADFPDVYDEPPFRAISLTAEVTSNYESISVTPFSPFPLDVLPVGAFGWLTTWVIEDEVVPEFMLDMVVGTSLYVAESCGGAIPYFEQVRENTEDIDEGLFIYSYPRFIEATCRFIGGDVDTAVMLYEDIILFEATDEMANDLDPLLITESTALNLATIYFEQGEFERSIELLNAYLELTVPDYIREFQFDLYFERADLFLALNKPAEAIAEITRLITAIESNQFANEMSLAWLYTERGYRYELAGNTELALVDYNTAIEIAPDYPVVYYRRGVLVGGESGQDDLRQFLEVSETALSRYHPSIDDLIADAEARLE